MDCSELQCLPQMSVQDHVHSCPVRGLRAGDEGIQFPSWARHPHVGDRGQAVLTACSSCYNTPLLLRAEASWDTVMGVLTRSRGSGNRSSLPSPAAFSLALAGEIRKSWSGRGWHRPRAMMKCHSRGQPTAFKPLPPPPASPSTTQKGFLQLKTLVLTRVKAPQSRKRASPTYQASHVALFVRCAPEPTGWQCLRVSASLHPHLPTSCPQAGLCSPTQWG